VVRFPDLFRRRREKPQPDPFFEFMCKAYYKGVRDTLIAIAWEIISKSIKQGVDKGDVYFELYDAAGEEDKRNKIIECIVSDGTNEQRARCMLGVIGLQSTYSNSLVGSV
jgi:hypothetical protein